MHRLTVCCATEDVAHQIFLSPAGYGKRPPPPLSAGLAQQAGEEAEPHIPLANRVPGAASRLAQSRIEAQMLTLPSRE